MDVLYFVLCMVGGAFVILVPWMGLMFAIFSGVPKTKQESILQARKQAAEHPSHRTEIFQDEAQRQKEHQP